jgi:hypothetical protein
VQSIPSAQFANVTPQVLAGLRPDVFAEVPVASLNAAPVDSFKYVSVGV